MSGLAAVLLHLLIVSSWHGSLARPNEDCDRYCFSTMRTVMDHVVADHDQNSTCKAANDTRKGQNEIKVQLAALQEAVSSVRASQESKDVKLDRIKSQQVNMQESIQRLIPNVLQEKLGRTENQMKALESKLQALQSQMENHFTAIKASQFKALENKLQSMQNQMESHFTAIKTSQMNALENKLQSMQTQMDSHLNAIKATLSKLEVKSIPHGFERIGQRYFYIAENKEENWVDAQSTCRRMGGHLASIKNKEEFDAIVDRINCDEAYFLGINDRAQKDRFVSTASGKTASFLKWRAGEPSHKKDQERCVAIGDGRMYVGNCSYEKRFICQLDDNI